jgi:hypothetical protein
MGGDVKVESKVGIGTRFIITLQLKANNKILYNERIMSQADINRAYTEHGAYKFCDDFTNKFK